MRPFTFAKTIILTVSAMLAASCVEPLQNNNSSNTPSVTLADINVKTETKYVTLSATLSNQSAVKAAGFYVSEDKSMSSPRRIDAVVGSTITAEYLPDGYGRTYFVKAFIGNGQTEKCTEVKQFTIGSLDSYVSLSASVQSMTSSSATVKAVLTTATGVKVTSKGFCYGEKEDVTIADNVIEVATSEFKAEVPCAKQIYIRSYVKDGNDVAYSDPVVGVQVESITLDKEVVDINVGESVTLTATVLPATATDKAVTWSSSDGNVATVTDGKVTAVGNGTATITATSGGKSATCEVTVTTKATGVQLNKTSLSLTVGESETLTATVLPATATDKAVTWSSSDGKVATVTDGKVTAVGNGTATITATSGGKSATCEVTVTTKATGVQLNKTSLSLTVGKSETLTATVLPATATDKAVIWKSSNASVATVDADGKVTALKAGSATVTVTTTDGGYTATCKVTVASSGLEAVDLGLSVKWASCNVGATSPEEYGGYYQWAGTKDVSSTSIYLDWSNCPYHTGSSYDTGWTKYNTDSSCGTVDKRTVLDSSDDAAHVNWGGSWRMPTDAEWTELRENCTWTWTTMNGTKGYKVTSKTNGNSIFLPAAGYRGDGSLRNAGSIGYFWSSSLFSNYPGAAYGLSFNSDNVASSDVVGRCDGHSVRPVSE